MLFWLTVLIEKCQHTLRLFVSNLELEFSKLEHRYDKEFSFDKKICTRTAVTFFNYDKRKQKSLILMSFVIIHTFPPPPKKYQSMNGLFVKKFYIFVWDWEKFFVTTNLRSQYLVCYILISFFDFILFSQLSNQIRLLELAANIKKKKNVSVGTSNFPKHLNFVFPPK